MKIGGGGGGLGNSRSLGSTTKDQAQTSATKRRVLRRMGKYLFRHPATVILAFLLMLCSNVLALAGPKLSGLAIDALAAGVGMSVSLEGIGQIIFAVISIGIITFALSAAGVKIGNVFGAKYKFIAELSGGIVLVLMGLKTLLEHLGVIG